MLWCGYLQCEWQYHGHVDTGSSFGTRDGRQCPRLDNAAQSVVRFHGPTVPNLAGRGPTEAKSVSTLHASAFGFRARLFHKRLEVIISHEEKIDKVLLAIQHLHVVLHEVDFKVQQYHEILKLTITLAIEIAKRSGMSYDDRVELLRLAEKTEARVSALVKPASSEQPEVKT